MVGPSKILTVSYGTFSCTLEGFDEPFSTMKAIAEYFRDLAADDRYFGAEPPTPDAQMLSKIAERELQRHVVAKVSDHGVVLRQSEAPPASEPMTAEGPMSTPYVVATPVAAPAAEESVAPIAEPDAPVQATPEVVLAPVAAEAPAENFDAAVVADKPAVQEPVAEEPVAEELVAMADEPAVMAEIESPQAEAEVETLEEDYSVALDSVMTADAATVEDFDLPEEAYDDEDAEDVTSAPVLRIAAAAEPAEDSIAAKLMRIRAVVEEVRTGAALSFDAEEPAQIEASAEVDEDFGFSIDMGGDVPALAAAEAGRAAQRAKSDVADQAITAVDASAAEAEPEVAFDDAFEDEDEFESETAVTDDAFDDEEPLAADSAADDALLSALSNLAADTNAAIAVAPAAAPSASFEAAVQRGRASPAFDDLSVTDNSSEDEAPEAPRTSLFERARASVIRLGRGRRATDEKAEAEHAEEAVEAEDIYRPTYQIDQDLMAHDDDFTDEEEPEVQEEPEVSRLMDEAKEKLEGAESRRRFSAISHLKAAVAATLADRQMKPGETAAATPSGEAPEEISLYRDDLSKAVRPRRPAPDSASATARPNLDLRPAPLVLVSEQRIDRPDQGGAEGIAIRPRRIATGNLALHQSDADDDFDDDEELSPEDASSFAEFAERLGASGLSDLLEAAAAYTASVEGLESFTRPQLMRKVEFVSSRGEYNREDGLRSFGMLLRQGKIQKVAKGQFAITDASKFMTEARRIAG